MMDKQKKMLNQFESIMNNLEASVKENVDQKKIVENADKGLSNKAEIK
jgi:hypothetical protein